MCLTFNLSVLSTALYGAVVPRALFIFHMDLKTLFLEDAFGTRAKGNGGFESHPRELLKIRLGLLLLITH